jgi:phenylalanyl-tRNA synthetase beta chain
MNTSLNWLQDHLDLSDKSTEELSDMLTFAGIEVEGIATTGAAIDKVVIAQINSSDPHPGADRLSVCQVDDGSGTTRQIVCGAKNYKVGDKVPLALPGAAFGDFKIKAGKLRGVKSNGMMCSGQELGLSQDHDGLLILPADAPVGAAIGELFESDVIFELEITPNRPDLLSHLGTARELAALSGIALKGAAHHAVAAAKSRNAKDEEIALQHPGTCPFYTARTIRGVTVADSPEWLKTKLQSIGVRPINNIVDITNYVLFEMGQPLHAFDLAKLDGGICVRAANTGEKLTALDGEAYALETTDLVIADQSRALAIGGIMGGEDSGVSEATCELLLESAYFTPSAIRKTSRRLNLSSDSSYRFERGIDQAQTVGASELATKLILEIAGGTADDELLIAGVVPAGPKPVSLDHPRASRLLGTDLVPNAMAAILSSLGLEASATSEETSTWNIPSYRADLERHVDLVEEIARVHGLDKIPARHTAIVAEETKDDLRYNAHLNLRHQLVDLGYDDCLTIKLISEAQLEDDLTRLRSGSHPQAVPLKRPLSQDHTTMRTSVLPGLMDVAERNIRQGATSLKFIEIGTTFSKHAKSPKVLEAQHLGIVLGGDMETHTWHSAQPRQADIHDMVGLLEALFGNDQPISVRKIESETLVLAVEVLRGKAVIGRAGQVWPARARAMDWNEALYVAEIDLSKAVSIAKTTEPVHTLPKFPAVTRDLAMEVASDLASADVVKVLNKLGIALLEDHQLFDVFSDASGEKLPTDRKSLAYSFTYRSPERTLTSEEVDQAHANVLAAVQKQLDVRIR